jgi:hypothetical protein
MKVTLGAVITEIDGRAVGRGVLRLGLHAVLQRPGFDRAQQVRGIRMWRARVDVLEDVDSLTPCSFGVTEFALDNRTLRADHFEMIWQLFGFAPPSLPRLVHRLALHDLAETRNDLAHGVAWPSDVARAKPTTEVLRMVGFVEDIVEHVALATDAYLTTSAYLR